MAPKIAWIDDDTAIIEAVIRPLIREGFEVSRFNTIQEALEAIEEIKRADLILLDMLLPPGDLQEEFGAYPGKSLLEKFRTEFRMKTPVLVLSVVQRPELYEELHKLKVAGIVRKPVLPSALAKEVKEVLGLGGA